MALKVTVRRVYGTPWSKLLGPDGELSRVILEKLGQVMVEEVIKEAKKEFAKQGGMRTDHGNPEGVPGPKFKVRSPWGHVPHQVREPGVPSFYDSFGWKIIGQKTVALTCNWPWIDEIIEGRSPFKMDWLTRERGITKIPLVLRDGTVIVRMAPRSSEAWIHPGFAKHNFINRAVKKARLRAAEIVKEEITRMLSEGDPTS